MVHACLAGRVHAHHGEFNRMRSTRATRPVMALTALLTGALLAGTVVTTAQAAPARTAATPSAVSAPAKATTSTKPTKPAPSKTSKPRALPGKAVDAPLFGMHVSGVESGTVWPTSPIGSLRLWDTNTAWSQVEKQPGVYDWTSLDKAVTAAQENKASVLLVLGSTPTWAASKQKPGYDYPVPGAASMPRSIAWWDRWVTAVVTRYKGRIDAYQIWNEASLLNFWNGTPAQMADLTSRAYKIIKSVDPKARVVAASTTTRLEGSYQRFFPPYLAALKARKWPVDVFSGHFYPTAKGTPRDRVTLIQKVQADLKKAGAPVKPLWDTESNFGLAGLGFKKVDFTGAVAAAVYAAAMMDSLRTGVSRAYWYVWTPPYDLLGVQMDTGQPAATALKSLYTWLTGTRLLGCKGTTVFECSFLAGSTRFTVAYAYAKNGVYKVPAGMTTACTVLGRCTTVKPGQTVKLVLSPVRFSPASLKSRR